MRSPRKRVTQLEIDQMVQLYTTEGFSSMEIGALLNRNHNVVLDKLRRAGVSIKGKGARTARGVQSIRDGHALRTPMYNERLGWLASGISQTEVARRCGVKRNTISMWAKSRRDEIEAARLALQAAKE